MPAKKPLPHYSNDGPSVAALEERIGGVENRIDPRSRAVDQNIGDLKQDVHALGTKIENLRLGAIVSSIKNA